MPKRIRLPQPRQTPANSGGESTGNQDPIDPIWDPEKVQRLINRAQRKGQQPALLCVGRQEAKALRAYLAHRFDDDDVSLSSLIYADLKIVQLQEESYLDIETLESIFEGSRHAQITAINQEMIRDRRDSLENKPKSHFRLSL
ncbi:MAG: hypothetical protein AAF591_12655 [Verrucomicrobiota bacterium]